MQQVRRTVERYRSLAKTDACGEQCRSILPSGNVHALCLILPMAEKTEQPTAKKLRDARKKGQVFQSTAPQAPYQPAFGGNGQATGGFAPVPQTQAMATDRAPSEPSLSVFRNVLMSSRSSFLMKLSTTQQAMPQQPE